MKIEIPFSKQFRKCRKDGTCVDGPFRSFEENPEFLPLFPNKKMSDAIKNGEWKGITLFDCTKFGDICSSGNEKCREMRGYSND